MTNIVSRITPGSLVLVTGASGLVGSHLTELLLARGYRVRCMVRRTSDLSFICDLPVEWAYADVCDEDGLRQACQGIDAVCHCAALTRAVDEETFLRVNAQGTEALARAAVKANPDLQRFLQVSSQSAVGPSREDGDYLDEQRPAQPTNWYGKSKLAAEQALLAMANEPGSNGRLPLTIVRPTAVFGPRDRDFFSYFELVKRGLELRLGREERKVSLIYVRDLVELIVLALEKKVAVGQTYFSCGPARTYAEFAGAIARALNKRTVRITLPVSVLAPIGLVAQVQERLTHRPALLNKQRIKDMREPYWLCSGEKARQELGFMPRYDLDTAVRETADWYQENGWF